MEMEKRINSQEQEEDVIDLMEIARLLLHKWKLLLIALLAGAVVGGAYCAFLLETTYRAEASLYITSNESLLSFSDLQLSSALTEDYAYIIKSRTVLERVIDEQQLDMDYKQLGEIVTVTNPDSSHVIRIGVTTTDPQMSRNIANSLLNISAEQINQIVGNGIVCYSCSCRGKAEHEEVLCIRRYSSVCTCSRCIDCAYAYGYNNQIRG